MGMMQNLEEAVDFLKQKFPSPPSVAIILGTGLSDLAAEVAQQIAVDFEDIPHFPQPTAPGHRGQLIFGTMEGVSVVAMSGRLHYYEGYAMQEVVFPVRVMRLLGAELLIASNAAGSTNPHYEAGDLVFIKDHINLQPANPLRGPNLDQLGPRFPDMLNVYDPHLLQVALQIAEAKGIRAHAGVYASLPGPNLETPAEYEYLHRIGSDVVGMSTVPEVLAARHMGMRCFVVSVVSNKSYPIECIEETTVETVIARVQKASPKLHLVVRELLKNSTNER